MAGRPRFKPTKPQRDRVKLLKAMGWSNERIAAQVLDKKGKPICRNTLETVFASELLHGADAKRVENIEAMQRAAMKGNASAGKWLDEKYAAGRAAEQLEGRESPASQPRPEQPAAEKPGKKELRQEAAGRVTGKFAPPPPPPPTKH